MDFFSAQQRSRRNTRWMVTLFVLAVLCMSALPHLILSGLALIPPKKCYQDCHTQEHALAALTNWVQLIVTAVPVMGIIGVVSAVNIRQLAEGGGGRCLAAEWAVGGTRHD
jgi:uncharacterized membrane protein